MIVIIARTSPARPAELIRAKAARHVVTTSVLLNPSAALRTEGNIVLVLADPTFKLLLHRFLTGRFKTMPDISTLEADLSLTVRANQFFSVFALCADGLATLRLRTPADKMIGVEPFLL